MALLNSAFSQFSQIKQSGIARIQSAQAVRRLWQYAKQLLTGLLMLAGSAWLSCALWVQLTLLEWLKWLIIALWTMFTLLTALILIQSNNTRWRIILLASYATCFAASLWWWHSIKPSNYRIWAADVAQMLSAERQGDLITLHNVRNFDWRSETDFTEHWESRQYDVNQLTSVDVITSHWMGPLIAHVLVSFGFGDGQYLSFSIETRKQRHQQFSLIGGFFRMYDLSLIAADEKDILYTRSNVRGEQLFIYRLQLPQPAIKALFESYVNKAEDLRQHPRFYNSLTSNCTTLAFDMAQSVVPRLTFDYRIVLSGFLPEYLYDKLGLDQRYSLEQLKRWAYINPFATLFAQAADQSSANYSRTIRMGIQPTINA